MCMSRINLSGLFEARQQASASSTICIASLWDTGKVTRLNSFASCCSIFMKVAGAIIGKVSTERYQKRDK